MLVNQKSNAYFSDTGTSTNNIFQAAEVFPSPTIGVFLNEFMPDTSEENDTNEWVEIVNLSLGSVDLTGWRIEDSLANGLAIGSESISPGQYKVYFFNALFNNSGDSVFLKDNTSSTVDSFTYTNSLVEEDKSIGRQPDGTGAFKQCTTTTQGAVNTGC